MAYISQERKKELAPKIKEIFKRYGLKGSISVRNHSTLVIKIKSGRVDFIGESTFENKERFDDPKERYIDVNPYWYEKHYEGKSYDVLDELFRAANAGNHNNSDIMSDYFDVGWYVNIEIGQWNAPYQLIEE